MTRMTVEREGRRERIENAQANLGRMRSDVWILRLRVRQAIEIAPGTGRLLIPVAAALERWDGGLQDAQNTLRWVWEMGNEMCWW